MVFHLYIVGDLTDRVNQFSRMFLKGVSQLNLPVAIKSPEMALAPEVYVAAANIPEVLKKILFAKAWKEF